MAGHSANSAGRLLQLFRSGHVRTRRELQLVTGLSRSTLTSRVDDLLAGGYLVEDGQAGWGPGRPSAYLRFDDRTPTILTADLGATHGRLAVCDAAGNVLVEQRIESLIAHGPSKVLGRVRRQLARLLKATGRDSGSVCGVGVGVPGPVAFDTGRVLRPPIMPGWENFPVADHLADAFGAPAFVENDANLMGLGEQRAIYPDVHSVLFVKVGTGIGAGFVLDGEVVRGADGAEGDIGHAKVPGSKDICACGAVGCLAAGSSGQAMARDLRAGGRDATTCRDVVSLVQQGDSFAVQVVLEAGRSLGGVLATVVSMLNPAVLVIGGDIAHAHEHFLAGVRETLARETQPLASAHLVVAASALGDWAGIAGAAAMVRERIFSPDSVDEALERAQV
jgi:predicted NBD/HSP70 family sugar kinase